MKKLLASAASWLTLGAADSGPELKLHALEANPKPSVVCGCEFKQSVPGAAEGSYGSGPRILIIDPNGEPPNARVNLGNGTIHLKPESPIAFPLYDCTPGATWRSRWHAQALELDVRLVASSQGAEACWFSGEISLERGAARWSAPVKGACGC